MQQTWGSHITARQVIPHRVMTLCQCLSLQGTTLEQWYWVVGKGKPAGSLVMAHGCGNAWCINPEHLRPLFQSENLGERRCHGNMRAARSFAAYQAAEARCDAEHTDRPAGRCFSNPYLPVEQLVKMFPWPPPIGAASPWSPAA